MRYLLIGIAVVVVLGILGYQFGSGAMLPQCGDGDGSYLVANNINQTFEECQKMVEEKQTSYQIQGALYGVIAGLIIGYAVYFVARKRKRI